MKFLVITLDGVGPDDLLADDRLAHLRSLMAAGLCGPLADLPASGPVLGTLADPTALTTGPAENLAAAFQCLRLGLTTAGDSPVVDVAISLEAAGLVDFDDHLGSLLEAITEDTGLLVVARAGGAGGFVLAGPGIPPAGVIADVTPRHLAATVRELAGLPAPASDAADSLLARADLAEQALSGYSAEDDLLIQERLSGLGYIA